MNLVDADSALGLVVSGMRVFVHTGVAAPQMLIEALADRAESLSDVEVTHLHTEGPAPYVRASLRDRLRVRALFVGANMREAVAQGQADYVPVFLSEIPRMFRSERCHSTWRYCTSPRRTVTGGAPWAFRSTSHTRPPRAHRS